MPLTIKATPITHKQGVTKSGKPFNSYKLLTENGDVYSLLDFTSKPALLLNKETTLSVGIPENTPLFLRN